MKTAARTVAAELGGITAVVAAAGIVSRTPLKDVSTEEFRRVFAVNVEGMQNTIAAAAPDLIEAGPRGAIVALGSVAASTGGGLVGSGLYAASKSAVVGLIRGYARELAPWGVRANVVAPAATETPMTQSLSEDERARIAAMSLIGRLSRPDEIASTVVFLLGPGAGSITGQVIQPNGGVYFN
jgi:NAD(P)-dependent dehydrogenase (short-subunit alcohol dehydrogenase family)